jgi:hypothetical protein
MTNEPFIIYGKLQEGLHITGYSFERACKNLEWILEDDRFRLAGEFEDRPNSPGVNRFLDSLRFDQLRPTAEARKRIAKRIKELQPLASSRQIATTLGAHHSTIYRDAVANATPLHKNLSDINAPQSRPVANATPPLSGDEAATAVRRVEDKAIADEDSRTKREERRQASRTAAALPDGAEYRVGDARSVLADIPENSVPLILTDPPYPAEAEPLYEWLGEWAKRVLIPGGSLICYTGHWSINRDTRIFDKHLRYWWIMAMLHDQSRRLPGKFVIAEFKPVLWYVKEFRRGRTLMPDVLKPVARDKELHNWSQGDGGVSQIIEHLTEPGELILDPFAGTGQWGLIAARMGRRWIGSDVTEGGKETVVVEAAE